MNQNMTYAMLGMIRQTTDQNIRDMPPTTLNQLEICVTFLLESVRAERERRIKMQEDRLQRKAAELVADTSLKEMGY